MSLHISTKMQGKMKGFWTLNTSPLDNKYCMGMSLNKECICSKCYSQKALITYAKTARKPWKRNGMVLSTETLIDIPVIDKEYFRFHSHGELINDLHYKNFIKIVEENLNTVFALYTKRKDIIKRYKKPDNLVLVYSEPKINNFVKSLPPKFDRRFSVFTKEYAKKKEIDINCHGRKCIECLKCYKGDVKFINELVK